MTSDIIQAVRELTQAKTALTANLAHRDLIIAQQQVKMARNARESEAAADALKDAQAAVNGLATAEKDNQALCSLLVEQIRDLEPTAKPAKPAKSQYKAQEASDESQD